jgi:hypothetical protein
MDKGRVLVDNGHAFTPDPVQGKAIMKNALWAAMAVLNVACNGPAPPPPPVVTQRLQVSRHATTQLDNARADAILADASNVLQVKDGAEDVSCSVALTREGDVTEFTIGDGSIDSEAEFNAVIGLPGYVKVVNQINWCGGLAPNIIGCAPVPGASLTAVRFTANLEGILWAHEYGHTKGLNHRNNQDAVMFPSIGDNRRQVNQAECDAYRK